MTRGVEPGVRRSGAARTAVLRPASRTDYAAIRALLASEGLPVEGVREHVDTFVVLDSSPGIVGVGGLEIRGEHALLRSLVVAAAIRGGGVAAAICDRLETLAKSRGVEALYLLTETAEQYFAKRGYLVARRPEVPEVIRSTAEFARLCPQTAVVMYRRLR